MTVLNALINSNLPRMKNFIMCVGAATATAWRRREANQASGDAAAGHMTRQISSPVSKKDADSKAAPTSNGKGVRSRTLGQSGGGPHGADGRAPRIERAVPWRLRWCRACGIDAGRPSPARAGKSRRCRRSPAVTAWTLSASWPRSTAPSCARTCAHSGGCDAAAQRWLTCPTWPHLARDTHIPRRRRRPIMAQNNDAERNIEVARVRSGHRLGWRARRGCDSPAPTRSVPFRRLDWVCADTPTKAL